MEANNREFVLSGNSYEYPENYAIKWSRKHDILTLEHQYKGLSYDLKLVSEIYQGILRNDGDTGLKFGIISQAQS